MRDKSSGISWMSWINTWLHNTINRLPSKSTLHWHIAVPWVQSAYHTKSHDLVPDCSAVRSLPFLESCLGRLLAYAALLEISRREQMPGRRLSTRAGIQTDITHKHTKEKVGFSPAIKQASSTSVQIFNIILRSNITKLIRTQFNSTMKVAPVNQWSFEL